MTKKKEIVLKGKGFIIRPYKKGDFVSIAKNANNKKIVRYLAEGFPSPYTEKDAKDWIKLNLKLYKKGVFLNFVIDVDGSAVGTIGSAFIGNKTFAVSFGYWLGEKYWNRGIVSKAVKLYMEYLFKIFKGVKRIEAFTHPRNKASQRVLEKSGFKLEGILRKSYVKDGKIIDKYMFSKLRNEQ